MVEPEPEALIEPYSWIDQGEDEIGQEIADMKARGWSLWEIAHHLNDLGVKTRRGGEWQAVTVKRVLEQQSKAVT